MIFSKAHIIRKGKQIQLIRHRVEKFNPATGDPRPPQVIKDCIIRASVQPVSGREILQVPEGDRFREHIFIYTHEDIQRDDTIIYNKREFEVQIVHDWEDQGLQLAHKRARAVLKDVNIGR